MPVSLIITAWLIREGGLSSVTGDQLARTASTVPVGPTHRAWQPAVVHDRDRATVHHVRVAGGVSPTANPIPLVSPISFVQVPKAMPVLPA
eukprot:1191754-Prorocentrum_minimum.AAC.4